MSVFVAAPGASEKPRSARQERQAKQCDYRTYVRLKTRRELLETRYERPNSRYERRPFEQAVVGEPAREPGSRLI